MSKKLKPLFDTSISYNRIVDFLYIDIKKSLIEYLHSINFIKTFEKRLLVAHQKGISN